MIRRLVVNEERTIAITASDDKTVRVWSLPDFKLQTVLRPPIAEGQEGRIFALALAPNGEMVAIGGWTGWQWDGSASVYIFDVHSGRLIKTLSGLPSIVGDLAFSKDGRYLAVGMGGNAGLRVYRISDYVLMMQDSGYTKDLLAIDFDRKGRFVTSSLDGVVRLYNEKFLPAATRQFTPPTKPVWARFSPDGSKIAVGTYSRRVEVLSLNDLALLYTPDTRELAEQKDLPGVAWSIDGRLLYAIGNYEGQGANSIYRWGNEGRGPVEKLRTEARARMTDLSPLNNGSIVYTAEDPLLGIRGDDARSNLSRRSELADFRDIGAALRVSGDASVVQFAYDRGGKRPAFFSLLEKRDVLPGEANGAGLVEPVTSTKGLTISNWKDTQTPSLNGIPLPLDREEYSRCLALAPDRTKFVLGGEWSLRLFDAHGKGLWAVATSQIVWGVAWSGDGKTIVAAMSDGTLRWYRVEDGHEYLALFAHRNGHDWIAWVPSGYYVSSPRGDNYVGWHLNHGKSEVADFYRAAQFDRILARYDIVAAQFSTRGGSAENADGFNISQLSTIAPPKIELRNVPDQTPPTGVRRIVVDFHAEKRSLEMQDCTVFINNIPITPASGRALAPSERATFSRRITFDAYQRDNRIRVEISNGKSLGFAECDALVPGAEEKTCPRGDLYVLAIGVNRFPSLPKGWQLNFAAEDADVIEQLLREQAGRYFDHVKTRVLSDNQTEKPDSTNMGKALKFIENAQAADSVIVFLSSHGLVSPSGVYYFLPRDASTQDVERARNGEEGDHPTLVRWDLLFDALRNTAGKRLLIVDTCGGRGVEGAVDARWLQKKSASAQFALMVSCKASEKSQEYNAGRHGLFTYALLQGLHSVGGNATSGPIRLTRLFDSVVPLIKQKREDKNFEQTPQLIAPDALKDMVITAGE